jgi:glycosyltransferase involved in cell wall biosynthesis
MKKLISIVTFCFNEEENIEELHQRIFDVMSGLDYRYEHIIIDNHSTDGTVSRVKKIIETDKNVKLIVNARNFGHIRSPNYGILQSSGDTCILMTSDLQDPPEMIPDFIKKWEDGYKIVLAVKDTSQEKSLMFFLRKCYYKFINRISEIQLIENATGAGLYDKKVIEILRQINDPYPYLRGLICEIGFPVATVSFNQPRRLRGITKNNFYTLYDTAMLGITNHSKIPLRLMVMIGFFLSLLSFLLAIIYFIAKLIFWNEFQMGIAPIMIGVFFFGAIQTFFLGILGEYIITLLAHTRKLPMVVELERINFD